MMNLRIIPILFLFFLEACGDDSPFDEDYWEQSDEPTEEEVSDLINYKATIGPITDTILPFSGNVTIAVNQSDVLSVIQLDQVPQVFMIGQRSITNQSCSDIANSFPIPDILDDTYELKDFKIEDNGTRQALIQELNLDDPQNGDSVNLTGKSFVIKAYLGDFNTPVPETVSLIPIGCGIIELQN